MHKDWHSEVIQEYFTAWIILEFFGVSFQKKKISGSRDTQLAPEYIFSGVEGISHFHSVIFFIIPDSL